MQTKFKLLNNDIIKEIKQILEHIFSNLAYVAA
jgi:hypothetical protein